MQLREEWKAHFVPDNHFPLSLAVFDVHKEVPHTLLPTCVSNSHNDDDDDDDNNNNNNNNTNNIQH